MIIGISGTDGGGKGTVVDYLVSKYQFTHYSSRAIILEYIEKAGLPNTRAQMRLTANELRAQFGNDFLVTQALERMKQSTVEKAVVESIRAVDEVKTLKVMGGILLAIDADQVVRYQRVQSRRSETDQVSFEQFVAHEELERHDPDPHGMQKGKVIAMADHTIMNDGTIEELQVQVDTFLQKYI